MTTSAGLVSALLVLATAGAAQVASAAAARHRARGRLVVDHWADSAGRGPGRVRPPAALVRAMADGAVDVDPGRAWRLWMGGLAGLAALGWMVGGPGLSLVAVGAGSVGPGFALKAGRGRAGRQLERALPTGLEAVARALRSGASLAQAVAEAAAAVPGPLGAELDRVAGEVGHGRPLIEALEELGRRRPLPGVRLAVAALCLGVETGGAQARSVDGVAATIRDRLAVAEEVRALSAQTRASMLVIALSPLAFGAFASATDPATGRFLFRTSLGLTFLVAGLGLDAAGALWMRRLARVDP
jgi:tight adherence protein B